MSDKEKKEKVTMNYFSDSLLGDVAQKCTELLVIGGTIGTLCTFGYLGKEYLKDSKFFKQFKKED